MKIPFAKLWVITNLYLNYNKKLPFAEHIDSTRIKDTSINKHFARNKIILRQLRITFN